MKKIIIPSVFTAVDKFSKPLSQMSKKSETSMARMQRSMRNTSKTAFGIAKGSAMVGMAILGPLALVTREAIKFEEQLADIGKTTGLKDADLQKFGDGILKLAEDTSSSVEDLATIGEIGGQLGIAQEDLLSFTEASDKFNIALGKDFGSVDEAISQVGKIKNLFSGSKDLGVAESINKVGSAINELGAIGAGTSANITDFTLRMGALPNAMKPTIQNTIAMGTFLEEMGISSERGASGLTKVLLVAGKQLGGFAKEMGITTEEAKKLYGQDPTEFVKKFAKSFNGVAPEVLAKKLKDLKLNSQEAIKVIGALGGGTDRLTKLQQESNKAFAEGNSLSDEAKKKNATTGAQLKMMKNKMTALSVTLGQALTPALTQLVESISPIIKSFSKWAKNNKKTLAFIMKTIAIVGALALALSGVSFVVGSVTKVLGMMGVKTLAMLGPIGLAVAGIIGLGLAISSFSSESKNYTRAQKLTNDSIETARKNTIDQRVEVRLLFNALKKAEQGSTAYNETLEKLNTLSPGIVDKYALQVKGLQNLKKAEDDLVQSMINKARIEANNEKIEETTKEIIRLEDEGQGIMETISQGGLLGLFFQDQDTQQRIENLKGDVSQLTGTNSELSSVEAVNSAKTKKDIQTEINTTKKTEMMITLPPGFGLIPIGSNPSGSLDSMPQIKTSRLQ